MIKMADALDIVKDLIETNWDSNNTDKKTPVVMVITDAGTKRIDASTMDYILLYRVSYTTKPQGLGTSHKEIREVISIDIRTSQLGRQHSIKVRDELERILDENIINLSSYNYMMPMRFIDLSDKTVKIWRYVYDIELVDLNRDR